MQENPECAVSVELLYMRSRCMIRHNSESLSMLDETTYICEFDSCNRPRI